MSLLSCPKQERLLEYVSVPDEMSFTARTTLRAHLSVCGKCRETAETVRQKCEAYLNPAPDITSSLLKVYSRLQNDETLILKGWKLSDVQTARPTRERALRSGWAFRGGLAFAVLLLMVSVLVSQFQSGTTEMVAERHAVPKVPLAQIRIEDRNTVKVHYVQPELLQSMEFETTSATK